MRERVRNQSGEPHTLELDLPCAQSAVRMARAVLRRFARLEGASEREIETMTFVASELLANAVDYGGGNRAMDEQDAHGVRMSLAAHVTREGWEVRVGDQGGGDPKQLEPFLGGGDLPDLDDERGRGFYLMAQMVQEMRVTRTRDGRGLLVIALRRYGATEQ